MSRLAVQSSTDILKKVLVIDDDPEIILNIQETLNSSYKIYVAKNSVDSISVAKNIVPDIILCQHSSLPSKNFCPISMLREAGQTKNIPILLLLRDFNSNEIRRGFDLGADDYLTYPFDSEEISSVINLRIRRHEQHMLATNIDCIKDLQLQRELDVSRQKLKEVRQFNLIKSRLIGKISTNLRDPLSNINMATRMLLQCNDSEERNKYLNILESECAREIQILNEVDTLHSILTLDNMEVLNRFNLLSP
jgi:two-component system, OmpR family, alkaline phosphatase synthesis response regulator PhoP